MVRRMSSSQPHFFVDADPERGQLLAAQLSDIPFAVKRIFIVTAPGRPVSRGGHVVTCEQLVCLVTGSVVIRTSVIRNNATVTTEHLLAHPGDSFLLSEGTFIDYDLRTPDSEIIVFASETFQPMRSERIPSDD
jgi:dTDP-4-dehydrorhamnose 3,5-epimerase-like enzyme